MISAAVIYLVILVQFEMTEATKATAMNINFNTSFHKD
jgi:hypothetical protein